MALVILAALIGLGLRAWVLGSPLGAMNADEAYTGLQAGDILDGRIPIVIQGSTYSAVLESYAFAPFVALFGMHVVPLKLIAVIAWAGASIGLWRLGTRVLPPIWAAAVGAMLWLAPGAMTVVSTRAYVGYALGMALVTWSAWALGHVVALERPDPRRSALAGGLLGLAFYVHPMFLAVVVPMTVAACVIHRARPTWWCPAAAAAVAVNLPFLLWNARNGWPSLDQPVEANDSYSDRFARFFTGLLPRVFGLRAQAGGWVFPWPIAVVLLLAVVAVAIVGASALVRRHGRVGTVVVAPLVLCWPLMAGLANLSFVLDSRYAVIPLPFLVLSVGAGLHALCAWLPDRRTLAGAIVALSVWVGVFSVPLLRDEIGWRWSDPNAQTAALVRELEARGADRIAGYYWLVLPIEYQSDRSIRAAVAGFPSLVRVPASQRLVEAAPASEVVFVFDASSDDPSALRLPADAYHRIEVAGAILYVPESMEAS